MIHRLDLLAGSVKLEDLSGTTVAGSLEDTTRAVVHHVSSVAAGVRIDKCSLVFRVCAQAYYMPLTSSLRIFLLHHSRTES
jgi:hypothetical protein